MLVVAERTIRYEFSAISDAQVPRARDPVFQHILDTYASETNKVVSVWSGFGDGDLSFKPHEKSSTVLDIMKHRLLSERRFFAEFLGLPEFEAARCPACGVGGVENAGADGSTRTAAVEISSGA